jgi:RNase P/RNase MRP subunit POP5
MLIKKKFRYICLYFPKDHNSNNSNDQNFTKEFSKRFAGLFGSVMHYSSNYKKIVSSDIPDEFLIIKCRLEFIQPVLLSLYFTSYPFYVLSISGTIKQLKSRIRLYLENNELSELAKYKHNIHDI